MDQINLSHLKLVDVDVQLKHFSTSDTEDLFSLTDRNRLYLKKWLPWLDGTKAVEDTQKFIEGSVAKAKNGNGADFGIYYQGVLVGAIGYDLIDKVDKKTTLGYWLDENFQGKGIMTKAVKLLIEYAFDVLKLNRIQINCAVGNTKSCAIPQRLGFEKEGVIRQSEWLYDHFIDWEQYSLLASEFKR